MPTGVKGRCTAMSSHKKVQLPYRIISRMDQYGAHGIGYQGAHISQSQAISDPY